ncbi:hypothetical protein XI06_07685 [Bradyrhizobium sp. CCBAU 11434]|nr:hypothetical protein [Bradyrhizobium sp. CCBAU 11434]
MLLALQHLWRGDRREASRCLLQRKRFLALLACGLPVKCGKVHPEGRRPSMIEREILPGLLTWRTWPILPEENMEPALRVLVHALMLS